MTQTAIHVASKSPSRRGVVCTAQFWREADATALTRSGDANVAGALSASDEQRRDHGERLPPQHMRAQWPQPRATSTGQNDSVEMFHISFPHIDVFHEPYPFTAGSCLDARIV